MGDRLATINMGRKLGAVSVLAGGRARSPCSTMQPGPRPTIVPSGILIHPAVWPQINRHGPKFGDGVLCPLGVELGPNQTQCCPSDTLSTCLPLALAHLGVIRAEARARERAEILLVRHITMNLFGTKLWKSSRKGFFFKRQIFRQNRQRLPTSDSDNSLTI